MPLKIVITDWDTVSRNDLDLSVLSEFGEIICYSNTLDDELCDRIKDANVVICNKTSIQKKHIDAAPELKLITLFATGYNNIDVKYAAEKGIAVCNAGVYSTNAVAQQTFAYILAHASRINEYASNVKDGAWENSKLFSRFGLEAHELCGKTLGIFGYGAIGKRVAMIAKAFDMRVIACTRTPKADNIAEFVDMDTLLRESDYISLHCPLNDGTRGLFGKNEFAKMKPTAYFINTARGAVTNEQELADALNDGVIAGAAVDVLSVEPMRDDCPLKGAKNLTLTPHVAWAAHETTQRVLDITVQNLKAFVSGAPQNKVY